MGTAMAHNSTNTVLYEDFQGRFFCGVCAPQKRKPVFRLERNYKIFFGFVKK